MTATVLANGEVLLAGGSERVGATWQVRTRADCFNPNGEIWAPMGELNEARSGHRAVLLESGEVLAAGGVADYEGASQPGLRSAELFDPDSEEWSPTGAMVQARAWFTATLLSSGKVLVVGGYPHNDQTGPPSTPLASAELYDPTTGVWTATGSLAIARGFHGAALLPSGKVMVVGGCIDGTCDQGTATVELWDPGTGEWGPGSPLPGARVEVSATRLGNGKVLVAGGCLTDHSCGDETRSAFLHDEAGGWVATPDMPTGHAAHVAILLTTGKVLVVAGDNPFESRQPGALYDPDTDSWRYTGPMNAWHGFAAAGAPLPNGKALLAGGALRRGGDDTSTSVVEIYEPEP